MAQALLTIEGLTKTFGEKTLFHDISFGISVGQKSALIARNGSGKSTLLNIIVTNAALQGLYHGALPIGGDTLQDSGRISFRSNLKLAYLSQDTLRTDTFGDTPVRSIIQTIARPETEDPWTFEHRVEETVTRMKLDSLLDRSFATLSGGEQKRVALCRLLIEAVHSDGSADTLLILDEPTNHLDIDIIEWLEETLSRQRLALLLVTHDRYFLDHVCESIYELDGSDLYYYRGHYDYYLEKKADRLAVEKVEAARAQSLYRKELEWMRRMPQARGTKAQARINKFYDLEAKAHTRIEEQKTQLSVKTQRLGGKILELYNITYSHPTATIVNDFSYTFKRGEKIGIVGPNGIGKSTLLNIITGKLKPTSGHVVVGQTIQFGYYTQRGMEGCDDRRVIDVMRDVAEEIETADGGSLSAHLFLSHFGFDDTTQYNYVGNLSGGERRRLRLLQVLMGNPNFLVLDEPTNDLDIETLEMLEHFLESYTGCVVVVSHDRSLLDHVADHLFVFEGNGQVRDYYGTYADYRRGDLKTRRQQDFETSRQRDNETTRLEEKETRRLSTASTKRRATYKEQKEYEALTAEIEELTGERMALEEQLSHSSDSSPDAITAASIRMGEVMALLDEKELRWLELDELM